MSNSAFNVSGGSSGGTLTSVGVTSDSLVVTNSPVSGSSGTMNIELPESVAGANMILNGNFQVMQRGDFTSGVGTIVVPASTTAYTLDRFQLKTNANQAFTVQQYNEPGRPSGSYQALLQRQPGQTGTGTVVFVTSLPRNFCRGAADRPVTMTVQLAAGPDFSPASGTVTGKIISGTGTTDTSVLSTWTGQTTEATDTINVGGGFSTLTITSPTLGSTVSQLALQLEFTPVGTAGVDDSLSIANFKCELGSQATPFPRDYGTMILSQCQAFACKSYDATDAPGTITTVGYRYMAWNSTVSQKAGYINFPTTMRAAPSILHVYSPTTGVIDTVDCGGVQRTGFATSQGMAGFVWGSNDANPVESMACQYFADAELY